MSDFFGGYLGHSPEEWQKLQKDRALNEKLLKIDKPPEAVKNHISGEEWNKALAKSIENQKAEKIETIRRLKREIASIERQQAVGLLPFYPPEKDFKLSKDWDAYL